MGLAKQDATSQLGDYTRHGFFDQLFQDLIHVGESIISLPL